MTPIGGFFELEPQRGGSGSAWHAHALALTSGRACLRRILQTIRPARLLAPFYVCDTALSPARALGIPVEFYRITAGFRPVAGALDACQADTAVLYVNYFDVDNQRAEDAAAALGSRAIIDDTQAFFRRGHGASYSFNSARKFFGVADGAYAYLPGLAAVAPSARREHVKAEHLQTRRTGPRELAYRQYLDAEADVSSDILAPSAMSERLLGRIAYEAARAARRRNFNAVHERLAFASALDTTEWRLDADAAPFCYPFLPKTPVSLHERLWARDVFAPRMWPEVASRPGADFDVERDLAARLVPLPIDQRYGEVDMARMSKAVLEAAG